MNDARPPGAHAKLCHDDLHLAAACLRGDEHAWRRLADAHFDFMREFARRFLPADAARELADEVIADLWTRGKLRQYEGRSTLRTWLAAVVAHAALNSRQALNRWVPLEQAPPDESVTAPVRRHEPEHDEAAALLRGLLGDAVKVLTAEERLLLRLYYEQGLTLDAIGAAVGLSSAAISRRLKRLREDLRATIDTRARREVGESAHALCDGLDFARLDVDLGKLLCTELSKQQPQAKEG
jgi:RNA polymerase sigma-70 factor, ECF subfamily